MPPRARHAFGEHLGLVLAHPSLGARQSGSAGAEPGGLGFIVLTGDPDFSASAEFDVWHREQRGAGLAHDRSRALKSGFVPKRLDAYHLPSAAALDTARVRGEFSQMAQGRQPDGAPREPKLKVNFGAAAPVRAAR